MNIQPLPISVLSATPTPKQSILKQIHRFLVGFSWPFIAFWIAATTGYLIIINIF
jgi:hypothetical protein